ncbi:hypothetical protein PRZ48_005207 [Zasmidium cellare]|uniref:F-box domain-containing protein n=1 Tax=Zasmidium cellare TaxID=395010 RepID=A0ABR0ET66_ZASCE|nr:hypothetical protein PRZ48_005207 [Zasmidium cellare]
MAFLDLPLELREQIYEYTLEPIVQPLEPPWAPLPQHHRFPAYVTLRLINRQIGAEIGSVWRKKYQDRLVFYFEYSIELYDFCRNLGERPACFLGKARFCLRARDYDENLEDFDLHFSPLMEDFRTFLAMQPSSSTQWLDAIRIHRTAPLENGSHVAERYHYAADVDETCTKYQQGSFPDINSSLCLNCTWWQLGNDFDDGSSDKYASTATPHLRTLVIEGKLCDIDWTNYDEHLARQRFDYNAPAGYMAGNVSRRTYRTPTN